jgi:hypothetical protein
VLERATLLTQPGKHDFAKVFYAKPSNGYETNKTFAEVFWGITLSHTGMKGSSAATIAAMAPLIVKQRQAHVVDIRHD